MAVLERATGQEESVSRSQSMYDKLVSEGYKPVYDDQGKVVKLQSQPKTYVSYKKGKTKSFDSYIPTEYLVTDGAIVGKFERETFERLYNDNKVRREVFVKQEEYYDALSGKIVKEKLYRTENRSGETYRGEKVVLDKELNYDLQGNKVASKAFDYEQGRKSQIIKFKNGLETKKILGGSNSNQRVIEPEILSTKIIKTKGGKQYRVDTLAEPTYASARRYFIENNKKAVAVIPDAPKKNNIDSNIAALDAFDVQVSSKLYNDYVRDTLGNFPTTKRTDPLTGRVITKQVAFAKENDMTYLRSTLKEDSEAYTKSFAFKFDTYVPKKKETFLQRMNKPVKIEFAGSVQDLFKIDISKKSKPGAFLINAKDMSFSLARGVGKVAAYENPATPLQNKLKRYMGIRRNLQKDKDVRNVLASVKGPGELAVSTVYGVGKQVSAAGPKITDFKPLQPDNYVLGIPTRAGRKRAIKAAMTDKDVQTAMVFEAGAVIAGSGTAGTFLVEGAGVGYGVKESAEGILTRDYGKTATGVAMLVSARPLKKITRPFKEAAFENVQAEKIFGEPISDRPVTGKGINDILKQFDKGKEFAIVRRKNEFGKFKLIEAKDAKSLPFKVPNSIKAVTASPTFFKGKGGKITMRAGEKGLAGIEDAGTYFGPKSRANPMFLEVTGYSSKNEFSFNPFANVGKKPMVLELQAKQVVRLPRGVINKPGFKNATRDKFIKDYLQNTGSLVISKRSEIGQGAVKRRKFNVLADIKLNSVEYSKGQRILEAGTSESEAIGLPGDVFRFKKDRKANLVQQASQYKKYTRLGAKKIPFTDVEIPLTGEYIRLPDAKLAATRKLQGKIGKNGIFEPARTPNKGKSPPKSDAVFTKKVSKGLEDFASSRRSTTKVSPSLSFLRSGSGSKTRSASTSLSLSRSTSQSENKSLSRSIERSLSRSLSQSKSLSQSRSFSLSRSLSRSQSKSRSASFSKSRSETTTKTDAFRFGKGKRAGKEKYAPSLTRGFRSFKVNLKPLFGNEKVM